MKPANDLRHRFPVYSRLIRLYPGAYRQRYEIQMLQTTADMLDNGSGPADRLAVWARLTLDLPLTIVQQQLKYAGGVMKNETPQYIKRNSLIAAVLLLPFFAALTANALDKVTNNHTLLNSWLWRMPTLSIWVIRLPELAFLLALGSYLAYVVRSHDQQPRSWVKRALDVHRSWPVLVSGLAAFGILFVIAFHDSPPCLLHSPTYLASHVQQTWQCAVSQSALHYLVFL